MTTDEQAEAFLEQDLSALDFSQFVPLNRDLFAKDARITLRLPAPLIAAVNKRAAERGIPYQRLIREAIDAALRQVGACPDSPAV